MIMATIKGPIKIISGGVASEQFSAKVVDLARENKTKLAMPFEATGWESSKNSEMIIGKVPAPRINVPEASEIRREIPLVAEIVAAVPVPDLSIKELEAIKGISRNMAIKLSEKYKSRLALIEAIKASNVPEVDKIRLGILRKAMGV
jgi:hypothetical protein